MKFPSWHTVALFVGAAVLLFRCDDDDNSSAVAILGGGPRKYPPGEIYKTEDLPKLVGKQLKGPSYLVGDFL
jgi:hypothetical protein